MGTFKPDEIASIKGWLRDAQEALEKVRDAKPADGVAVSGPNLPTDRAQVRAAEAANRKSAIEALKLVEEAWQILESRPLEGLGDVFVLGDFGVNPKAQGKIHEILTLCDRVRERA